MPLLLFICCCLQCLCRSALSLVLERFAEEPGMVVELVRAALAAASSAAAGSEAGEAHAAGGSPAEALALELVGDDRLLEAVCEEAPLRRQLLGLLWNHAVHALTGRQACETALAFFTAALPLLDGSSGGGSRGATQMDAEGGGSQAAGPQAAECRRAQALCCLSAGQFDRCGERWVLDCILVLACDTFAAAIPLQPTGSGALPAVIPLQGSGVSGSSGGAAAGQPAHRDAEAVGAAGGQERGGRSGGRGCTGGLCCS